MLAGFLCSDVLPEENRAEVFYSVGKVKFRRNSARIAERITMPRKARREGPGRDRASARRPRRYTSTRGVQRSLQNELQKSLIAGTRFLQSLGRLLRLQKTQFSLWTTAAVCITSHLETVWNSPIRLFSIRTSCERRRTKRCRNSDTTLEDKERDRSDEYAESTRDVLTRELMKECLQSNWSRLWAAETWAEMDVLLC